MENESEEYIETPAQIMKQLLKLQKERTKLRRKIPRSKNLLIKHIDFGSGLGMLKDYKEEAETALKRCMEINEDIVDNYIEDSEMQEFEEEEQEIYREDVLLAVEQLKRHLKRRRDEKSSDEEESLAMT